MEAGTSPSGEKCEGTAGLIGEGEEVLSMRGDPAVIAAALIAAGTACRALRDRRLRHAADARRPLDLVDASSLLDETLDE
ncbi:MAG: DUF892 family protein [Gaiellaceae bacterium]